MIGRDDLLIDDGSWALASTRQARMEEWNEIVHTWTTQHTTAEIVELASLLRIPVAPVTNGKTVLDHPHFVARGVWDQVPDGSFTYPLPPYRINGERPRPRHPSPKVAEHQNRIEDRTEKHPARLGAASSHDLPLAGVKVIDATAWWAGPSSTQALAALGAEVIHLESIQRLNGPRMTAVNFVDLPDWWERSPLSCALTPTSAT